MSRKKNSYRLNRKASKNAYDWWWHSLVAEHSQTGELKPFFFEYYVINPGLWKGEIIWGQKQKDKNNNKPCYAMIKAGSWGDEKAQLNNFFGINEFSASKKVLDCKIGNNTLNENKLSGEVSVSEYERDTYPERMSDAGYISWNLSVEKNVSFDVGYGSSELFNRLNAFHMYWHAEGMVCRYSGEIMFMGQKYIVKPETSYGYQDKNWGKDYTNPWIWLNCNNFFSKIENKVSDTGLDIGGGCPRVFGFPLNRRILTALYYKGELIEFNFSKFLKYSKQKFESREDDDFIYWDVISENKQYKIDVKFKCKKTKMLLVNYENPKGEKNHNKLWNGGHAQGRLKIYKKESGKYNLIDDLEGTYGGCEYGEYHA